MVQPLDPEHFYLNNGLQCIFAVCLLNLGFLLYILRIVIRLSKAETQEPASPQTRKEK